MLVLSRKVGEEVMIGDNIKVRILEIQGNRIKLGFTAPDNVSFQRMEVTQRKGQSAMQSLPHNNSDSLSASEPVIVTPARLGVRAPQPAPQILNTTLLETWPDEPNQATPAVSPSTEEKLALQR